MWFLYFSANVWGHFFQNKQGWASFFPGFCPDFQGFCSVFKDFARIFRDFARIFDKSKRLGVCLHPRLLHHWASIHCYAKHMITKSMRFQALVSANEQTSRIDSCIFMRKHFPWHSRWIWKVHCGEELSKSVNLKVWKQIVVAMGFSKTCCLNTYLQRIDMIISFSSKNSCNKVLTRFMKMFQIALLM